MAWKVIISPSALGDLESLVRFIAQENPAAAARVGSELISRAERLADFPQFGRVVPKFQRIEIREIICRTYRVIYRVQAQQETVEVIRFWHGARGVPQVPEEDRA